MRRKIEDRETEEEIRNSNHQVGDDNIFKENNESQNSENYFDHLANF